MTMQRISWSDQRINGDEALQSLTSSFVGSFFGAAWYSHGDGLRPMGEGEHEERDGSDVSRAGSAFHCGRARVRSWSSRNILDRPATSLGLDQSFDTGSDRTTSGEEDH